MNSWRDPVHTQSELKHLSSSRNMNHTRFPYPSRLGISLSSRMDIIVCPNIGRPFSKARYDI